MDDLNNGKSNKQRFWEKTGLIFQIFRIKFLKLRLLSDYLCINTSSIYKTFKRCHAASSGKIPVAARDFLKKKLSSGCGKLFPPPPQIAQCLSISMLKMVEQSRNLYSPSQQSSLRPSSKAQRCKNELNWRKSFGSLGKVKLGTGWKEQMLGWNEKYS